MVKMHEITSLMIYHSRIKQRVAARSACLTVTWIDRITAAPAFAPLAAPRSACKRSAFAGELATTEGRGSYATATGSTTDGSSYSG